MDPSDLLFLHAQLAATIRAQVAEISRLNARITELETAEKED